jgi:cyclopropane fatty-acyl-phospholipid synthase-like methyltransferase
MPHRRIIDLYERRASDFDKDRSRTLHEKRWLDTFLAKVPESGRVLDLGCGMGEPIARYILESGRDVVGVDSSESMIAMCRARFPEREWIVGDMRELDLGRRFDGIVAWDSFFHLHADVQSTMFRRLAAHAEPGAPLMFTSGTSHGEAIGSYHGEPLYHASLDRVEYQDVLEKNGFEVCEYMENDPECGEHTVWLAAYRGLTSV